jgi:hypothetical protein
MIKVSGLSILSLAYLLLPPIMVVRRHQCSSSFIYYRYRYVCAQ